MADRDLENTAIARFGDAIGETIEEFRKGPPDDRLTMREMIEILNAHASAIYQEALNFGLSQHVRSKPDSD